MLGLGKEVWVWVGGGDRDRDRDRDRLGHIREVLILYDRARVYVAWKG